ncbi:hypothetical protein CVM73_35205 [Bradyrhizobium forestalis]|uniref:Uncharacterized protein n=1 Tax=Bradyrhizobium forestalis TaxID=1419263 RepID=A0A2M8QYJ3_9BRAD|nr:hypothetical protein [Bradyrhizobium forestalis]PJG50641.1 hypothetical protein CVM73_35205 [Bradyrhizobium forestalis]
MLKAATKKTDEPVTRAVLSSYNEQVEGLGRAIEEALRAKLKLIIVGSVGFLRVQGRRYRRHKTDNRSVPAFLAKISEVFDQSAEETLHDGATLTSWYRWPGS